MACSNDITDGFVLDCENAPIVGIEQTITIFNTDQIDKSATTFNADGVTIESIVLQGTGNVAYQIIATKNILNAEALFVLKDDTFNGWNHKLNVYAPDLNPEALVEFVAYTNGAEVTAIVQQKFKGADGTTSSEFKVYGYRNGMVMTEANYNANENGGLPFVLSNLEGMENSQLPYALFLTSQSVTQAVVDALLVPVV